MTTSETLDERSASSAAWRAERCRHLLAPLPVVVAASAIVALILVSMLHQLVAPAHLGAWIAAIVFVVASHLTLWQAWRRAAPGSDGSAVWLRWFRIITCAAGLAWAAGAVLLFRPDSLSYQTVLALAIAGICAAAAVSTAADRTSLLAFTVPPLATLTVMFLRQGGMLPLSVAAILALYLVFLIQHAMRAHRSLRDLATYRKAASDRGRQLETTEARVHHLLSAGPVVVYSCAIGEGFPATYVSPNVESLMGYKPEDFLAGDGFWAARIHPDDRARVLSEAPTIVNRDTVTLEYRFRRHDGSWRWTLDKQVLVRDATGAPVEVAGAWTDITAQKSAEEALRRQSEFQSIVAGISADLIDAGTGRLDAAITGALMKVGTFLKADRCYMFRFSADFETIDNTHEWCAPGIAPQIDTLQNYPITCTPWHFARLRQGGIVDVPDVDELPPEAEPEKREFHRLGLKSILSIAVRRQGDLFGFLGIDSVARKRDWDEGEAALLRIVADMIAGALIRERAAKELIQSNRLLDSLVENMPAMVFMKRAADLRFELLNRAGETLIGFSRADLLGRNDYDFFPKEQADHFVAADRAVLASDVAHDIREEAIRTASGETRQLRTSKIALRDAAGNPTHLLGISVDITETKRVEDALRQSQARLLEAQHIARLGHWAVDIATGTIEWSRIIYDIFGRDPAEFRPTLDRYYAEIVHPDDADALRAVQEKVLATGEKGAIDHRFLRPDGSVGWIHVEGVAEYDASGRAVQLLGIVQEVTERKTAEVALKELNAELERRVAERTAALAESQERLERGQRIAKLGSWEYDLATMTWHWSDEFFHIFGLDPKKSPITAESWLATVHPDDRNWVKEALRIGRASRQPQEIQYRIVLPDGQIRVIRARGEELEGKRVGSVMDVTERAQVERALAEARRIARLGGWEWNSKTGERWWSAEMFDILGVDSATFDRNSEDAIIALIHPADRARVLETWNGASANGGYAQTFRLCRPDGQIIVCQERGELQGENRWAGSLMDITDLVRTQEKLAEAQRIAHLGSWESNEITGELRWSDEVYRIHGFEPDEIKPTVAWLATRIYPDDLEPARRIWAKSSAEASSYECQYRIVRPDGEVRVLLEIGEPTDHAGAAGASFVGTILDVTERARTERSLAEAQRIARTGSWEYAPDSGIESWSAETYRLLGFDPATVRPSSARWRALIHAADRDGVTSAYRALIERHEPFEIRYRLIREDGETRHVIERGERVGGTCSGTITDITELERTQRSLAEAQRIAHTGSWEALPGRQEEWWSDELYDLLGFVRGRDQSTEAAWNALIHPDDRTAAVNDYQSALERRGSYEMRYRLVRATGELRFMVERGQWSDDRFIGTLTDITEQERIQRQLAEAQRIAKTGSWELIPDTDFEWWSEETYRLAGVEPDSQHSRQSLWFSMIHPDDRKRVFEVFDSVAERKTDYEVRYRLIRPDGDTRYVVERGAWLDDRYTGTVSDITESERVHRSMTAAQRIAETGSWEYLPDSGEHWWSDEMYRLLGLARDRTVSEDESWDALIHPEDSSRVIETYRAAHRNHVSYEARYRVVRPDGELRFMVERGEWVGSHHIGTLTDITEQERIQRGLAEAQRIAATGSWEYRPDTDTLWWSDEMYRLLGVVRGDEPSTDATWDARIHPEDRAAAIAMYRAVRKSREPYELRYRLLRPKGEIRFMVERGEWSGDRFTGTLTDITEQEHTQRSLAEAQRVAAVGSWEWVPGTKRLRWSAEALRIFGYDDGAAERDNRDWQRRVHPEDLAEVEATLDANRERGVPFELKYRIVLPNGAVRAIHERIESDIDDKGILIREVGIFRDITESRQLELAMQALSTELIALDGAAYFEAAAARLAQLVDTEHALIVRRDAERRDMLKTVALIEHNKLVANIEYCTDGTPCAEVVTGKSVMVVKDARARYPHDLYFVHREIESYAAEPISDHTGSVIGHVGVMSSRPIQNATTTQTILRMFAVAIAAAMGREQIHRRDTWLRAILENSPSEITLKDRDLRIMATSGGVHTEPEVKIRNNARIGKSTSDLFPPEVAEIYETADRKVIETGQVVQQEVLEKQNGRNRYIQNVKFPMRDESGQIIGICSISTDVTDVKRIEAQLAQAQKMEALGALTGGMAHDFNNYLAVIIGNLEMLREDLAHDPRATRLVDSALRGATRSEELTRSLLAFARHQPLAPSIVDVAGRIRETASLLERTLGEETTVALDIAPGQLLALVDDSQLASCIVNLANNARDAMPDGGEIRISAKTVRVDVPVRMIGSDVAPGDYVVIEVADTGSGMTPEVLENVFEPFFTTKGPGHGTGLGLSMVYGFVKQSEGHVRIYSEPDFGTTVRIYLPATAAATTEPDAEREAESAAGNGEVILLVEDNEVVRRTTASQLTQLGYRVIEAANGDAAVAILDQRRRRIDLMLSDVVMPGKLDGYDLVRLAREKRPGIKVLLTSGFVANQLRKRHQDMPDVPLLTKPCRKAQLARAIRSALAADFPPNPAEPEPVKPSRRDRPRSRQ